jgi:hypothetical protein
MIKYLEKDFGEKKTQIRNALNFSLKNTSLLSYKQSIALV